MINLFNIQLLSMWLYFLFYAKIYGYSRKNIKVKELYREKL